MAYGLDTKKRGPRSPSRSGRGTLTSILKVEDGCRQAGTSGDTHIGGDDIDLAARRARSRGVGATHASPNPEIVQAIRRPASRPSWISRQEEAEIRVEPTGLPWLRAPSPRRFEV